MILVEDRRGKRVDDRDNRVFQLFEKAGYSVIREIIHEEWKDEEGKPVFVCPDRTKTVQLVFKRI